MTRIKEFRLKRKMKAIELARILNISRAAICYIEKNGIRNADAAERYAAVLHCHPAELIDFNTPAPAGKQDGCR